MLNDSILSFISFIESKSDSLDFMSQSFLGIKFNESLSTKRIDATNYINKIRNSKVINYTKEDSHYIIEFINKDIEYISKIKLDENNLINSVVIEINDKMDMIVLVIEYDGSKYYGMQKQKDLTSIQGEIENALFKMVGKKIDTIISSRTDRGVHAKGQVISFKYHGIEPEKFMYALNNILPNSIRIKESYKRSTLFNPRYDTIKKTYEYIIKECDIDPFTSDYYCFKKINNKERMKKELKSLIGSHDFIAFSKGEKDNTTREILEAQMIEENDKIILRFTATGFLHNMIRFIVGALFDIDDDINSKSIKELIDAKDKNLTKRIAPASGLYLIKIYY